LNFIILNGLYMGANKRPHVFYISPGLPHQEKYDSLFPMGQIRHPPFVIRFETTRHNRTFFSNQNKPARRITQRIFFQTRKGHDF